MIKDSIKRDTVCGRVPNTPNRMSGGNKRRLPYITPNMVSANDYSTKMKM